MKTFIVEFWARVFSFLTWISPFSWVRAIFKKGFISYLFVDIWATAHLLFSFLLLIVFPLGNNSTFKLILLIYGSLRIFEILIYQVNVMFFDEYRTKKKRRKYALKGYRRLVILFNKNYIEIIFWYSFAYSYFNESFTNCSVFLNSASQAIAVSFNAMTSFGFQITQPINMLGYFLYFSQSAIGVFMVIVILAKFIGIIPPPKSMDMFEK
jgi:hypothetical protein